MAELPKIKLKADVPAEVRAELPGTTWGKVLGLTPVVMTVIATMLAGLSSSEMTRAQYERALAAQRQSKAGDQWSFFQAKRLRAITVRTSLDTLQLTQPTRPVDAAALRNALAGQPGLALLDSPAGQAALAALRDGTIPKAAGAALPEGFRATLTALEQERPEAELSALVSGLSSDVLDQGLRQAKANALAFDSDLKPITQAIDSWEKQLAKADAALRRDYVAARMNYSALRFDAEARANQVVANAYELQVRASNSAAERHQRRSGRFFYGMLGAQLAVIVSTFAMAARQRNLLWAIAATAGSLAVAFTVYVLLSV
jgi:hypothetical protein